MSHHIRPEEMLPPTHQSGLEAKTAEELYHSLFQNSYSVMLIIDQKTGAIVDANTAACHFYGFSKEEIRGMQITDINTLSMEQIHEKWREAKENKRNFFTCQHRVKDGGIKDVEIYSGPITIAGTQYQYSIVHDISERKKIEAELLKSEKLIVDVFESVQDGVSVLDKNLTIQRVNRKMNQWYVENTPLEGKKCYNCYHNTDTPCDPCPTLRCLTSGEPEHDIIPGLPGSPVEWVELYSYPIKEMNTGVVTGVVEFVRDITERVQAEKALAESEEKYRLLVENATEAIVIAQDGCMKYANPRTLEIIGYEGQDISDIPFTEFIHPDDREMVADIYQKRMAGYEDVPSIYSFRVIGKNGAEHVAELNSVKIIWEGRPATLNFIRDMTEQRKLESSLRQAQKMEAIGTLAGGIAHDFNNLLMGIQGRSSLIMSTIDGADPIYEHVQGIENYVKSASKLTQQLLGFARGGKYKVVPTNLNKVLRKSVQMFGRTRKEIQIQAKYQEEVWAVEIDRGQIEQVLLNLLVNAWQAMPGGGKVYLQTENVAVADTHSSTPQKVPGRYVKISITDTGVGIDERTRRRIFEPFFTTKEIGRGTGLGLASAYGIIKNHKGYIDVSSEIGHGSTFTLYLPASEKGVLAEKKPSDEVAPGTGTVLLVDDEQIVIDVGSSMLERLGYHAVLARSGQEAIKLFQQKQKEIDLVILDMIMPDMGGGDVFKLIKAIDPEVKVLLSSGYSLNGQATDMIDQGCKGFIQKPFSINQLSQKLREILLPPVNPDNHDSLKR